MSETSKCICEVSSYPTAIFYKAVCCCLDDKHTQTLILEKDSGMIGLSIHSTIYTKYDYHWCDNWKEKVQNWFKNQTRTWKYVFTLLFTGQVEGDSEFIFQDEKQIRDYISALESGIEKLNR